jgi:hypothetical protein
VLLCAALTLFWLCCVRVDVRDARCCVSTLCLGCQTSRVPYGFHSLFAVAVLLMYTERLLHVHGIAVCRVVTCATVAVSLPCRVG